MKRVEVSGFTLVELAVVIAIFLVMIIALTPFVRMARERANAINCADNLRKISLGLQSYAADNKGVFPKELGVLYPNYVKEKTAFDCPSAKSEGTPERPEYKYFAGLTEESGPKEILAEDFDGNHGKSGKNVLKVGGAVDWQ